MKKISLVALYFLNATLIFGMESFLLYSNKNSSIFYVLVALSCILLYIPQKIFNYIKKRKLFGFILITPAKKVKFLPLTQDISNMVKVVDFFIQGEKIKVFSDNSKINVKHVGQDIWIEDHNLKNSILINRRKSRNFKLFEGDIIDMGELTLLFTNYKGVTNKNKIYDHFQTKVSNSQLQIMLDCACLVAESDKQPTFYLSKNIVYIGKSEINDLVIKSNYVASVHSKIENIADKFYITSLGLDENHSIYVNGKKVEYTCLEHKDIISFNNVKYIFYCKSD